jgi:hypothetical protein
MDNWRSGRGWTWCGRVLRTERQNAIAFGPLGPQREQHDVVV